MILCLTLRLRRKLLVFLILGLIPVQTIHNEAESQTKNGVLLQLLLNKFHSAGFVID